MNSISTFLSLVSLSLIIHIATADTYTKNSHYTSNLNNLFPLLSRRDFLTGGFGKASTGKAQNKVNGLALCRGDVSSSNCAACIKEASRCPENKFNAYNKGIAINPEAFNKHVKGLLSKLADTAQRNNRFYAIGDVKLGESDRLYGLTQCSRDLTSSNCKECIDDAISELMVLGSGSLGGGGLLGEAAMLDMRFISLLVIFHSS